MPDFWTAYGRYDESKSKSKIQRNWSINRPVQETRLIWYLEKVYIHFLYRDLLCDKLLCLHTWQSLVDTTPPLYKLYKHYTKFYTNWGFHIKIHLTFGPTKLLTSMENALYSSVTNSIHLIYHEIHTQL